MTADDLLGAYTRRKPSLRRRMSMEAFDALPAGHMMFGMLELDVRRPLEWVHARQAAGERVTLVAVLIRAIAVALAEHPELNSLRDGSRIVTFEDVDVNIPVERETASGPFPHSLVIRRASTKTPQAIFAEIEAARRDSVVADDQWTTRLMQALLLIPKPLRSLILRRVASSAKLVKRKMGTTFVTSVGKFGSAPGFVIPLAGGPRAAAFALGSVVERPVAADGEIAIHPVIGVTLMLNHDLVDGAPAARFATRLQRLVEDAEGLEHA